MRQEGNRIVESAMAATGGAAGGANRVVKTKRFAVKPMAVEEAIMQMELLGTTSSCSATIPPKR